MTAEPETSGAKLLAGRLRRQAAARDDAIPAVPRDGELPLSFAQQRLWVLDRLRPGGTDYLVPIVLRLRGELRLPALRAALTGLLARHEVLRTRYPEGERGEPVQVIDDDPGVELAVTDLTGDEAGLAAVLAEDTTKPFDLAEGPVLRARLVRAGDGEHVLIVVVHHIAMDGWSSALFVRELAELYAGGEPAPPPLQYADFAAWQRGHVAGDRLARGVEHWCRHLEGLPPLELPADRQRPAVWDASGQTVPFEIPAETAAGLAALAREHHATPFMAYLAALWVLLSRYSGQDDFAVGTPVAGRTRTETEPLLGVFINMLVLRADLTGAPTFRELLMRARTTAIDAYGNQEVPFERLVDELAADRDLSTHPLFTVNFVMQNTDPVTFTAPGLTGEEVPVAARSAKFDLTWTLEERPDGSLAGEATFATALFDESTVDRMAGHFVRLLDAAIAEPDRGVADLPLLGEAELAGLVRGPADDTVPHGPCLHERFAEQARRTPDAVALRAGDERISYAELDARANRLAQRLRGLGVGREDLVGICLRRSANTIVAILGVLKAGAAYLPLDPDHPAERIAYILDDASARVALTERALTSRVPGAVETVVLDDPAEADRLAALPAGAPATGAHPDDLAYVIYTSGSTGKPKGVQVSHANVVRLHLATAREYQFGPDDVWALFHSYAFDVSVWEIWGAFLFGGSLVVVSYEVSRSPWDLVALLADEGVTVLNQTPSAFRVLVELAERGDKALDALRLRWVVLAGEAVDVAALEPWWRRFGDTTPQVVNMYGITETTVHVTFRKIGLADLDGDRSPIGGPMADLTMYVLDPELRPVPAGVPGELFVGGPGVTRGYLGRPALTAQRYVPDPFGPPGARLYRSGDKARVLANGDIGFLGRFDHQVKIRGFRIELGEVESCLSGSDDVENAVVTVHEPAAGDRRLVAYLQPKDGAALTPGDARAYAAEHLPGYMVPAIFVIVPKFPLTVNGKVDRRALPDPDGAREQADTYVAPRTAAERAVAEVWSEVLGIGRLGVHDNFFALGGDSIRAIRLVGALRAAGYELSVQDLFRRQTIAELVRDSGTGGAAHEAVAPFALLAEDDRRRLPGGLADAYPMSMVQVGMISEQVADRALNPYQNITSYLIRDADGFDPAALTAAANEVVARHEVLRTSFDLTGYTEPLQLVHESATIHIGHEDLRGEPEQERVLAGFRARSRAEPFDLATAPLVRLHVHRVAEDRWYLHFAECHAVLDGWSHNSLVTELLACYRAARAGTPLPPADTPPVRFADFIAAERRHLAEPEHREFWASRIRGTDRLTLPASWADEDGEPFYELTLEIGDLEPRLRALAASAGASYKSVLVAAHLAVWRAIGGDRPFFGGLVANGRPEVEGADLVRGMFLNTVPFAAPAAGTWRELVRAVFAEEAAIWPHRGFPMPAIQRAFGSGERLLEVVFNYLDFHVLDREAVDTAGSVDYSPNEFPLEVSTQPGLLLFSAQSQRIGRRHTEALRGLYRAALEAMAADPDADPGHAVLPAAERAGLVAGDAGRAAIPARAQAPAAFAEPAGAAEQAIAGVWASVLGADRVGANDDFFALGGDSLLMMRIIIRLREEHGIELAFRDFVQHRTVRGVAASTGGDRSTLQWHTRAGAGRPLFCVHPGGGSAHWYAHLADELARPLAAFEWPGLNGEHAAAESVEETAALYLADLRAARPEGPYDLLGWCGGGGIAWEMARRLTEAGERVRLVLLDPVGISATGELPSSPDAVLFRRGEELCAKLAETGDERARAALADILHEVIEDDRGTPIRPGDVGPQWIDRLRTWRELVETERAYRFAPYPGSLDLVVCDELAGEEHVAIIGQSYADYLANWGAFARGGLRTHRVPGDHLGVLRPPHVSRLAAVLTELLEES